MFILLKFTYIKKYNLKYNLNYNINYNDCHIFIQYFTS